jgi:hypothetical protein
VADRLKLADIREHVVAIADAARANSEPAAQTGHTRQLLPGLLARLRKQLQEPQMTLPDAQDRRVYESASVSGTNGVGNAANDTIVERPLLPEAIAYYDRHYRRPFAQRMFDRPEDLPDVLTALHYLCELYGQAPPVQRAMIREGLGRDPDVYQVAGLYKGMTGFAFEASKDPKWLERYLLMISMQDLREDFREVYFQLGGVYILLEEVGLNPQIYFSRVAELSNPRQNSLYGQKGMLRSLRIGSTRDFLLNFHKSPFFAETIRPKLVQLTKPAIQKDELPGPLTPRE